MLIEMIDTVLVMIIVRERIKLIMYDKNNNIESELSKKGENEILGSSQKESP